MFSKFLSGQKSNLLCRLKRHKQKKPAPPPAAEKRSSALRIVHAGGLVENYYMAVPAVRIMEKYPSFILARPEVFRQPWNSLVRPDEILIPGEKFFVVPRRTIVKLRRRIKRPSTGILVDSVESDEIAVKADYSGRRIESEEGDSSIGDEESESPSSSGKGSAERRRVRNIMAWKPSLFAIDES